MKALCRSLICKYIMLSRFNTNSTILSGINISWASRQIWICRLHTVKTIWRNSLCIIRSEIIMVNFKSSPVIRFWAVWALITSAKIHFNCISTGKICRMYFSMVKWVKWSWKQHACMQGRSGGKRVTECTGPRGLGARDRLLDIPFK